MDTKKLSRRDFLRLSALTAAGAALAACAPAATPAPAEPAPEEPEKEEPTEAPAEPEEITLELWAFVNTHARWFESMAEDYKAEKPYFNLDVSEIAYTDLHDKAQIALQAGGVGAPDFLDLEQGRFGGFLRGGDPGLVDLADLLKEGGYMDKLVASRQALYTYKGKVYGVEHALTPVVFFYRTDVFEEAGIDMEAIETWDDFIDEGKGLVSDTVKLLAFPNHELLLRSRGADYFDADGNVTLDSDLSIDTMDWILALRDEHGVSERPPADDAWWAAIRDGTYLSKEGADWYAGFFKDNVPELSGKWRAIALPAFEAGGVRTSCHGGTGSCIVKYSDYIDEAWDFMQYSMLSIEGNVRRYEMTNLFPPFIPAMDDPRLHKEEEYFDGQDLGGLFAELGPSVPAQYQSPYRAELNSNLSPQFTDMYEGNVTPEEVFTQVSETIRDVMAEESA